MGHRDDRWTTRGPLTGHKDPRDEAQREITQAVTLQGPAPENTGVIHGPLGPYKVG